MGIRITKNNKVPDYSGFMRKVFLIAPFFQILLWLNSLEAFVFWGLNDSAYDFFILLVFSFGVYFLVKVFFLIARKWQKWAMYAFVALIVLQTGAGLVYKYYKPNHEYFSNEDERVISEFIDNKTALPKNMEVLIWNDSIGVIGKRSIMPAFKYWTTSNYLIEKEDIKRGFIRAKKKEPLDFKKYKEIINAEIINDDYQNFVDFWSWQYPNYLIYIYIKKCKCENKDQTIGHCYTQFWKLFDNGLGNFKPILRELFEGKLDDRYLNFYKFFKKLANPTYVRTDLANDPYFLIYQSKYQEARERLKDLPPARREFCEKKLEALGY